jgi:hypothetical protein
MNIHGDKFDSRKEWFATLLLSDEFVSEMVQRENYRHIVHRCENTMISIEDEMKMTDIEEIMKYEKEHVQETIITFDIIGKTDQEIRKLFSEYLAANENGNGLEEFKQLLELEIFYEEKVGA